jgi:ABC-type branched-subunit amino acid transport system substrate-binding protein
MLEQGYHALRKYSTSLGANGLYGTDVIDPYERRRKSDKIRVGLLVPFSGNDAIWGPSGQYSAILAAALVNASGGILGKEIELIGANSGGDPNHVVGRVQELIHVHEVDALVGVHMSNVRVAIRDAFAHKVPYVYATQYEGGENTRGLFTIGETPREQYGDAVRFMIREMGAKRWHFIGNDYIWPRETNRIVKEIVEDAGGEVVGIDYMPFGGGDHKEMLRKVRDSKADIIFESLVGTDCVMFNQVFGEDGMSSKVLRLSGVIEENVLMGIGCDFAENLYGVSGYFNSLGTLENKSFLSEYQSAFGNYAPIQGGMSQPCYESIFFLASLARATGSLDVEKMTETSRDFTYEGARGRVRITDEGTSMNAHLMRAVDMQYDHVCTFPIN